MKTTKIIAGLIVSALVSTTGVFAANTTSTGMAMPTTAKVAHTKKVVKKTTLTAAQKTAMAAKIAAKKTTKKVTTKKVVKKTTKKVASVKK
jgi:hypothetical protein